MYINIFLTLGTGTSFMAVLTRTILALARKLFKRKDALSQIAIQQKIEIYFQSMNMMQSLFISGACQMIGPNRALSVRYIIFCCSCFIPLQQNSCNFIIDKPNDTYITL